MLRRRDHPDPGGRVRRDRLQRVCELVDLGLHGEERRERRGAARGEARRGCQPLLASPGRRRHSTL